MARTVESIQAEIAGLKRIRATGARRVRFRERETEFNSLKDINEAIALLEEEIGGINNQPRIRQVRFQMSKGL